MEPDDVEPDQEGRALLALGKQFRDAALRAGRDDVVAKIDEAILLVAREPRRGDDKANAVLRLLDGLGF